MKIVYLIDQIYKHGGAEKILTEKANYFADVFDYDISIITTEQKNKQPRYQLSNKVKTIDIAINYNRALSYFNTNNLNKIFKHYKKLKQEINKINPDYIILLSDAFDYYMLPFITKSQILKEFHSSQYASLNLKKTIANKVKRLIRNFINKKYNYLVVLTNDEKQILKGKNVIVIPNGINTKPNNKISSLENKTVISAGRIAPVKNFEGLILAWNIVEKKTPNWNLEIYGEGSSNYLNSLKQKIKELNLNRIQFRGATNNLLAKMQNASIYVMSSLTECFPLVLLEAKTCGLPIVSFDCPYGPRNIISNKKDGFLVEDQNVDELANKLLLLIKNKELRNKMGNLATQNIQTYYMDKVMNQWKTIFENE